MVGYRHQALPRGPQPPADCEHDKEHEAVADLVEVVVDDAGLGGRAGGAAVRGHSDAARVGEVGDNKNDLLHATARWKREDHVSNDGSVRD